MFTGILTSVITPIIIGIVIELFSYWLNKKDDN